MIKVVWLCHFANQEIKEYFSTPDIKEFASWINNLIELFKDHAEVELHIVAPNIFNNKDFSFIKDRIHYHLYAIKPMLISKKMNTLLKILFGTNYHFIQLNITRIIDKIKPDIIHLHGAENPIYSAGIVPLVGKYPILLTIQGFIRNASSKAREVKKRIKLEEILIKKINHIGVCTKEMSDTIISISPKAQLYFHDYPSTIPRYIKKNIGKDEPVDCLFFARVSKDKGIEDLLAAISLIKKTYPNISLSVIGGTKDSYLNHLRTICSELHIENNVQFLGFFHTQNDIYKYALQAKICVLPTYHDIIPGTIIESMFMKLPVIAYAVGGIPELNENEETLLLVDKQNINQLADTIIHLLNNIDLRKTLSEKAYKLAQERFTHKKIVIDILNIYKVILNCKII